MRSDKQNKQKNNKTSKLMSALCAGILSLSGLAVSGVVSTASAQVTIPVILVIDRAKLLNESEAGKNIAEQANALRETISAELEGEFDSIKKEQKQLEAQAALLDQDELKQRSEKLRTRMQTYEKTQALKNREYQLSVGKASNEISKTLQPILAEILQERSATLLLDSSSTLFANPDVDITAAAMKKLNEQLKAVKLVRVKVDDEGNPIDEAAAKDKKNGQ